eukprot:XP_020401097.1 auxin-responsive protein IAA5-like [Zea mays]
MASSVGDASLLLGKNESYLCANKRPVAAWATDDKQAFTAAPPAAKAQVVGWPPVQNYRKNTLAASSSRRKAPAEDAASTAQTMYVKIHPSDKKVDYQIQKLTNAADNATAQEKSGNAEANGKDGHSDEEDLLKYRPNPDMMDTD